MRLVLVCMWSLVSIVAIRAQVEVVVIDGTDRLPFVQLYNQELGYHTTTDIDGVAVVDSSLPDSLLITISYTGYTSTAMTMADLRVAGTVVLSSGVLLSEVVLIGRTDEQTANVINQVEQIKTADIRLTNPQTSADALGQHAGVYIQKSQMGGGSPVVRGFEANKVLLVVDGVRMNNAIYRSGHLQNAITVDPAILERMEVVYGPGSLMYGSDALGGVIHLRSMNPQLNLNGKALSGEGYTRYSSASNEQTAHIHINAAGKRWASLTSISASDFGDLRTGSRRSDQYPDFGKRVDYIAQVDGLDSIVANEDVNLQVGTGYKQLDLLQKVLYQHSDKLRFIANFQHSTSSNVPRYDALLERDSRDRLRFAEWYYGPQRRTLVSLRTDHTGSILLYDKLIAIASYQRIDEDRIDRRYRSDRRDEMQEDVGVYGLTVDLAKQWADRWQLHYGVESSYNTVASAATTTFLRSGIVSPAPLTRYPSGGSTTTALAAYAYGKYAFKKLDLQAGMRYSHYGVSLSYLRTDEIPWPEDFYNGVESSTDALSWSLGGQLDMGRGWRAKAQVATAFRAPNVDDLAKIRINNEEVSIPNVDLQPELALTSELTVAKSFGSSYISATAFSTRLDNAIIRVPFQLPDGSTVLVDEVDTLQIVANVNATEATVWGLSITGQYQLSKQWALLGNINYTKGTSRDEFGTELPLAHIPPVYGRVQVGYTGQKHTAQLVYRYNGTKPLDEYGGSADNAEYATVDGTPAWATWNTYYQYQASAQWRLSIGVENMLDVHYRPFASGVSAPGRNITATVGLTF